MTNKARYRDQTNAAKASRAKPWAPRQRDSREAPPRTVSSFGPYEPWRDTPAPVIRCGAQDFLTLSSVGYPT